MSWHQLQLIKINRDTGCKLGGIVVNCRRLSPDLNEMNVLVNLSYGLTETKNLAFQWPLLGPRSIAAQCLFRSTLCFITGRQCGIIYQAALSSVRTAIFHEKYEKPSMIQLYFPRLKYCHILLMFHQGNRELQ